jgi:hypothetical protein
VVDDGVPLRCATCSRGLQGDGEDDRFCEAGPACGECRRDREREREDDFFLIDLLDGELDGQLD